MEFIELIKLGISLTIPALITIAGWFIVNMINAKRERNNKKRDKVVEYLITSYKTLTDVPHRNYTNDRTAIDKLEDAVTYIQLFGTKEQVRLAKEIGREFSEKGRMDINPLAMNLRTELRKELGLKGLGDEKISYLRIMSVKSE